MKFTQAEPMNKISPGVHSITYRTVDKPGRIHVDMIRNKVDTVEKMFLYVSKVHGNKRCLGTRQILAEEDEVQPNGRVFKKVFVDNQQKVQKKYIFVIISSTTWVITNGNPLMK